MHRAAVDLHLRVSESIVTLYGLLDAALDYSNQGGGSLTRLQSGGPMAHAGA